jgi:hypothetical protein
MYVAEIEPDARLQQCQFSNRASGHKGLIGWLQKRNSGVRVSLEATGINSLDLALALDAVKSIELAMLNPKMVNGLGRRNGDPRPMPPMRWCWPSTVGACPLRPGSRPA